MASWQMVEVEWTDARTIYEQLPLSAAVTKCTLTRRKTLGYLIHRDRERLVICHTFDAAEARMDRESTLEEDSGADFTVIPRGWVQRLLILSPQLSSSTSTTGSDEESS